MRARPEQAPNFSAAGQITPVPGPQREVLALARLEAGQSGKRARSALNPRAAGTLVLADAALADAALVAVGLVVAARLVVASPLLLAAALDRGMLGRGMLGELNGRCLDARRAAAIGRNREPVIRVRPPARLVWILAGHLNLRRQRGQLVAAPLSDDREGLPVQHQAERDLIRQACLVKTRDRRDAEQRSIYAA